MENEAIGGERIRTSAWRDGFTRSTTIDEVVTYTQRGSTTSQPFNLEVNVAGSAAFVDDSTALPANLADAFNAHLNGVLRNIGTYTHTTTTPGMNETVNPGGMIFTRHATLILHGGLSLIEMPLLVSYDGEGDAHHRLYYPYPVDTTVNYTSFEVRYFLNDFLNADGSDNAASSFSLTSIGTGNTLTLAMSPADRTALNQAVTDVSDIELHFTERDGDPSVFIVDTATDAGSRVADHMYAGYVRSNVELMGYTYNAGSTAPDPNGAITFVIEGDGGGTDVIPNPGATDASPALTSVTIDGTIYRTGDVTVDGTPQAGQIGRWVTGPDGEPNSIGGIGFTDLASLELVLIETNTPLVAADLVADREYMFRISTRNPATTAGTVLNASNFFFNTGDGEAAATTFNADNPTTIGSNTAVTFLVSWNQNIINLIANQDEPLLEPTVRLPGIGQFIAGNDATLGRDITLSRKTDLFLGERMTSGTFNLDGGTVNWRVFRTGGLDYTFVSGAEVNGSGRPTLGGRGFWTAVNATNMTELNFFLAVNTQNSNNLIG